MLPGPDIIHECPYCQAQARKETLMSGNTFGAKTWSDGFWDAPMLPSAVRVTRCPRCRGIFWVKDAKEIGKVPKTTREYVDVTVKRWWWFGTYTENRLVVHASPLKKLPMLTHLDVDGLRQAVAELPPDPELFRQRYLRVHLWWRFNDRYRQEPVKIPTRKEITLNQQNLSTLITLYDPQDEKARWKFAAMLIGLERFGDAKAIAEMEEDERLAPLKMKFIEEAELRKSGVFRVEG